MSNLVDGLATDQGRDEPCRFNLLVDGKEKTTEHYDDIINPFDLSVVGKMAVATTADLDDAVAAAKLAFASWSRTDDDIRKRACLAIAKVFSDNAQELAELITKEQGKPLDAGGFGSRFEVGGCGAWSEATANLSPQKSIILDTPELKVIKESVPIGVVGSITPWNWPLLIAVWHILPAIRAGNTVVVKPSPFTPLSTARAVQLIQDVLPPGVLNLVSGAAEIGSAMSQHPDIKKLVFTGSTATGVKVLEASAEDVKRVSLELGGNDAAILLPGAAHEEQVPGLFFGSMINAGQTCGAIKRLYVHEDDYDAVCAALAAFAKNTTAGNGLEGTSILGPIQNKPQWTKVKHLVADAVEKGAKIIAGGDQVGDGYCITPVILKKATQDMSIVQEEQFGPALPIVKYSTVDEAVAMANDSEFGLCASVWGQDKELLSHVASRLEAGTVYINTHAELHPMVPFGGHKQSGLGVQFGEEGLAAFSEIKITYHRLAPPT